MIRTALRSVLRVNVGGFVGTFLVLALATALLAATGDWLQAGWASEGREAGAGLLLALASSFAGTTMVLAVFVVASTMAMPLRRRRGEFAVLRAVGATAAQIRVQVVAEAVIVVVLAALVGLPAGVAVAPLATPLLVSGGVMPAGFTLPTVPWGALTAVFTIVPTAVLAAMFAARESIRLTPARAVRQSGFEPATLSRGRRIAAFVLALAGLADALVPLFFAGTLAAAAGSASVLFLIVAAALGGPSLIAAFVRPAGRLAGRMRAPIALAAMNTRGFARRTSTVVIMLALLVALGSVQAGVGAAAARAAGIRLEDALNADLVVSSPRREAPPSTARLSAVPGIESCAVLGSVRASVQVDGSGAGGLPAIRDLTWEPVTVRTVAPAGTGLVRPDVTQGSLAALAAPDTVAVSRDALAFTGKGVGDTVGLRLAGEAGHRVRIVAVYDGSLGLGDYLVSGSGRAASSTASSSVTLVRAAPEEVGAVGAALTRQGLTVQTTGAYVRSGRAAGRGPQVLSIVLLLALLAFIAIAAWQSLATTTSDRRAEFTLLRRIGATTTQILAMVAAESAFVGVGALVVAVGVAAPALVGFGLGVLGDPFSAFAPAVTGGVAAVAVALPVLTMCVTAWCCLSTPRNR